MTYLFAKPIQAILIFTVVATLPHTAIASPIETTQSKRKITIEEKLKTPILDSLPLGINIVLSDIYLTSQFTGDEAVRLFSQGYPLGLVRFELQKGPNKILGNVTVRGFGRVATAITPIPNGEVITQSHFRYERHEITMLVNKGFYLEGTKLNGLRAYGYIRPGTILTAANTKTSPEVDRMQMVELVDRKGSLVITAQMQALESGKLNDWIKLQNPQTKRIVQAKVTGPGTLSTR